MSKIVIFNANDVAKDIAKENKLLFSAGQFYQYKNGVYRPVSDYIINVLIKEKLDSDSSIRRMAEVFQALSLDLHQGPELLNPMGKMCLNLLNGMLNVEEMRMFPHDPLSYSTVQLNVNYEPKAECPQFKKAIHEWLGNTEKVALFLEFLGYCLTYDVSQEKILFLVGSGANGKSTLLHLVGAIFGKENCSAIPLDKLANRFDLAQIYNKALNIGSETPSKSVLHDDIIKSVVSGDLIQAERKFKEPFFFKPHAKLIVACNDIPRTEDKSDALYRRLLILRFNRTYTEQEQDKSLKNKLIAEKDGIFNLALNSLKDLRQRGYFKEPEESIVERESYRKENNSLISFVEEECDLCDQGIAYKDELYQRYKKWCEESGLRSLSKQRFGKALKEHYKVGEDLEGPAYERRRIWTGIVLAK